MGVALEYGAVSAWLPKRKGVVSSLVLGVEEARLFPVFWGVSYLCFLGDGGGREGGGGDVGTESCTACCA
jgi:hypothetical protein